MANMFECLALFPTAYQAGIRSMLAVIASTDEARNGRARYSSTMAVFQDGLDAETLVLRAAYEAGIPVGGLDRRPVGVDALGDVVWVYELWREAIGQLAHEADQYGRWDIVARRAAEADDAQQCADDLGIKHGTGDDFAELERVGLGGLIDAAELNQAKPFRGLGPR